MPRTQIQQAFKEAVCTQPSAPPVRCSCGQLHEREDDAPLILYGQFGGVVIVKGCDCQASGNIAGSLWANRHPVRQAMIDVLPVEMGREE